MCVNKFYFTVFKKKKIKFNLSPDILQTHLTSRYLMTHFCLTIEAFIDLLDGNLRAPGFDNDDFEDTYSSKLKHKRSFSCK